MNNVIYALSKVGMVMTHVFHLNKLAYFLSAHSKILDMSESNIQNARDYLELVNKNVNTSCITENEIKQLVDLHIIIPAFNVEKYIEKCLDTIVQPTKRYSYHVTVINDGSTDCTSDVLKKYKNISELEIIEQDNKGFSGARNKGLQHIVGRYIMFVDSDDYVNWKGIEAMLDCAFANDADAVEGTVLRVTDNGKTSIFKRQIDGRLSSAVNGGLAGQPWGKIIKSDFFLNICFPEKYWYEDSINAQIIFPKLKKCYGVSKVVYYYRKHRNSITVKSERNDKSIDALWITLALYQDRQTLEMCNDQYYYDYILKQAKTIYGRVQYLDKKVQKNVFMIYSDWVQKEFSDFTTKNKRLKTLENALKNGDFGIYKAYCRWL